MKDLFTSRKFWAAMVGIVLVFVSHFWPALSLDGEALTGALVILSAYMLGAAVDPGPGGWRGMIQSRKFWAAAVGVVFMLLRALGVNTIITEEQVIEIVLLVCGYIAAVALERAVKTPAVQTPAVQTPAVITPGVQTPAVITQTVITQAVTTPQKEG
jgi:hypothetical protein